MKKALTPDEMALLKDHWEKAKVLHKRILESYRSLEVHLMEAEGTDKDVARMAKAFLWISMQLSGQIVEALSKAHLLLATIGERSLLEYYINAKYVFEHPKHNKDLKWMKGLCDDLMSRTIDHSAYKQRLGGLAVKERARAVGLLEKYESDYARLCDFAHMTNYTVLINDSKWFKRYNLLILQGALCYFHDIGDHICNCFGLQNDVQLEDDLVRFRDSCIRHASDAH